MATETLILRPSYVVNRTNCAYFPSDFDVEQIHLLIAEETADNDSTYIIIGASALTNPNLSFVVPKEYQSKTPTAIKICGVARGYETTEAETLQLQFRYTDSNAENGYSALELEAISIATDWTYFETSYPSEQINAAYEWMINNPSGIQIITNCDSTTKNTAEGIALTQMYLEVTYEEEEDIITYAVYLKNNGVWETNRGVVYKKIDGSWQEATPVSLSTDIKYKVIDQRQYEDY